MEVIHKNQTFTLSKKERKVKQEAPSVRVKMFNQSIKVIGMMAPRIQVMITLPCIESYDKTLNNFVQQFDSKTLIYIITSSPESSVKKMLRTYDFDEDYVCNDFIDFANKFGVNMHDEHIAKSVFVIDKEGIFTYIQTVKNTQESFGLNVLKEHLHELIHQKQKGHTHENWMG
jgi:thiol peroxidase